MTDTEVTFDWNGQTINFSHWADSPCGVYEYTTRNQKYYFKFDLVPIGSEIRIYILEQPGYGLRDNGGHATHRLQDAKGNYICILPEHKPTNVPDALTWLVDWSEKTARYIDTGISMQAGD